MRKKITSRASASCAKTTKPLARLLPTLFLLISFSEIRGQAGNDNPTGPSGMFNGNVTTGCSYDPYTANARRTITDMVVAGAVGQYGLGYSRTWNSRGGGWLHSHTWAIQDIIVAPGQNPTYVVSFPDGRAEFFNYTTSDIYYRAAPGVRDRLQPWTTTNGSTGFCYLVLPDGGKVEFLGTRTIHSDPKLIPPTWYEYVFTATAIIDPYGLRTTFTYNPDGSFQITEPAGRWIKVFYTTISGLSVIDYIQDHDGRVVNYTYEMWPGAFSHVVLTSVNYYGDASLTSTYTYAEPNGENINFPPLLATCDDPMYAGPMKKISYMYATRDNPDGTPAVYGQILSEKSGTTGQTVSTLTMNDASTRTETRADGEVRTFVYGDGYLYSWTDFKGVSTSQAYDPVSYYVSSITDRRGNKTDFTNNPLTGAVTEIKYPATPEDAPPGRGTLTYTYGSASCHDVNNLDEDNPYYLCGVTDEAGNMTKFTRDTNKRVVRIDYPDTSYETFLYDPIFGQMLSHRRRTGGIESFTYDGARRPQTYRNPVNDTGNPTARYQYDSLDRVSGVTDVFGSYPGDPYRTTNYQYNTRGQVTVTTLPFDPVDFTRHTIVNTYNSNGDGTLVFVSDQLGHITSYTYDDYRRMRSKTTPPHPGDSTPRTTWFSYDVNQGTGDDYTHTDSQARRLTLPSTNIVKTTYDENYWKSSVTRSAGSGINAATTSYGYDAEGNITSVVIPDEQPGEINYGKSTSADYDQRNRLKWVKNPSNKITSFTYDAGGRKKTVTRPNGQVITYDDYDTMNRLLQQTVTQAPGPNAVTKYTYDPSGLEMTMQDPRLVALGSSEKYTFEFDMMGRATGLTYPRPVAGGIERSELLFYDSAGRVQTYTNRADQVQTFSYDNLHRQTGFSWSGTAAPSVAFVYDPANRVTSITSSPATITRTYFDDNLLKTETQAPAGGSANTVTYSYTPDSDIETILYPWGKKYRYKYTGRNQIKQVQEDISPFNYQAEYVYDVNGNLSTRKVGNNLAVVSDWSMRTPLGSVTHVEHPLLPGPPRTFDYKYNSMNDRFWAKRDGVTPEDTYGYDLAQQLTSSVLGGTTTTLGYDANGNRMSVNGGGTYASNNLNQYTTYNGLGVTYDVKGNLATYNGWTYTYDAQNRLTTVQQGAATVASYSYDGFNRQIKQTINGGAPIYNVWAGWNLIEERGTGNSFLKGYLYGAGEIVKSWNGFGVQRLYYQDGSGSTSHLSDASGNLLERYSYDGFGKPTFANPAGTPIPSSVHGTRHLFQGQLWTQETGLNDHRHRQALPTMGIFMQPDPIGFGGDPSNLYRYCGNNAVNLSDPFGLVTPPPGQQNEGIEGVPGQSSPEQFQQDPPMDWGWGSPDDGWDALTQLLLNGWDSGSTSTTVGTPGSGSGSLSGGGYTSGFNSGGGYNSGGGFSPGGGSFHTSTGGGHQGDGGRGAFTLYRGINVSYISGGGYNFTVGVYLADEGEGFYFAPGVGVGEDRSVSIVAGYQDGGVEQFKQRSESLSFSFTRKTPGFTLQLPLNSGYGSGVGRSATSITGAYIITPQTYITPPLKVDHTWEAWWTMGGRRIPY